MHIAFITPEFPHDKIMHSAGIGTSIKNLVTALVDADVQVTVFVYAQMKSEVFVENGVSIHLIENKNYSFGKWFFYRKFIQKYVETIVKKEKINAIEAPDWTGITAFMKFSVPLIIRLHGSDTYFCHLENRKQKKKNFIFESIALKNAKAYVAPTDFAGKISGELFGISPDKIKTIHYGLELQNFKNKFPEKFEKNLILYIGTIIRKKGVLELPRIIHLVRKKIPEAHLVLIGNDSPDILTGSISTWELVRNSLKEEDRENVSYLGKIPYQEVKKYIEKAHVCVFPTYAETLGMVTIESMAMKKPVVNSNIGWAKELLVNGESGYLVHPSNHLDYADKINNLLVDGGLCLEIGEKARKRVEDVFDIEKKVIENIQFYKKVIHDYNLS